MKPRLLDLFCGAGGAAMGYHRAGFDVVGVDIVVQPNYPFPFAQADALDWLEEWVLSGHDLFDAIHASPPCQAYSDMRTMWNAGVHPDLIGPTRELLQDSRLPYVIENVPGAPLVDPVTICGASVGLRTGRFDLARHRIFEMNWTCFVPPCAHGAREVIGIYGDAARSARYEHEQRRAGPGTPRPRLMSSSEQLVAAREAFEMPWANWRELTQAIPPAYTELIGHQLLQHVRAAACA